MQTPFQESRLPSWAFRQRKINLTKLLIVAAVLVGSIGFAYMGISGRRAILVLLFPVGVGIVFLFLRRPPVGILALVAGSMMVPLAMGPSNSVTPTTALLGLLVLLWVVDMLIVQREIRIQRGAPVYLLLIFSVVVILSFIAGQLRWFEILHAPLSAQAAGAGIFLLSFAAFFLAAHQLDEVWLQRLVYLLFALSCLLLLGRLLPPLSSVRGVFGTAVNGGSMFWVWLVSLATGLAAFDSRLRLRWRISLLLLAALAIVVNLVQNPAWASGWIPAIIAVLVIFWLRAPRLGWLGLLGAAALMLARLERVMAIVTDTESWAARTQAWEIVLDTANVNPLLGLGPANYYFYVQRRTIVGWGGAWNVSFSSHNNYVDLIAQTGFVGLLIFFLFVVAMAVIGWRLYQQLPDGFARGYAAAALAGLAATVASGVLGDWFLPFVYNVGISGMRVSILFWLFMGGLLALYNARQRT